MILRHYLNLTEREAAEVLHCSVGNIKSLTSHGIAGLRRQLAGSTVEVEVQ